MPVDNSRIAGFYQLSFSERRARVAALTGHDLTELEAAFDALDPVIADKMVENALGQLGLPLGVALNFTIDGRDYVVPMACEEPSVIAAASHAAKRVRESGGFETEATEPLMEAQIEVRRVADVARARTAIGAARAELEALSLEPLRGVVARGGGLRDIVVRSLDEADGSDEPRIIVHLVVDCRDAMGANLLNTLAERLGSRVAELCAGDLGLQILSNYCDRRLARARCRLPVSALGDRPQDGATIAGAIADASRWAECDPYRAVTHNKGVMNGVDAVLVATGNDWRAVESAAHAYAAREGRYRPLSRWYLDDAGDLLGELELPLAAGIVGGALRVHPAARLCLEILGVEHASELARVAASVGLASNLAALRALSIEGIQRGHMDLHRRA